MQVALAETYLRHDERHTFFHPPFLSLDLINKTLVNGPSKLLRFSQERKLKPWREVEPLLVKASRTQLTQGTHWLLAKEQSVLKLLRMRMTFANLHHPIILPTFLKVQAMMTTTKLLCHSQKRTRALEQPSKSLASCKRPVSIKIVEDENDLHQSLPPRNPAQILEGPDEDSDLDVMEVDVPEEPEHRGRAQ